ncbi:TIGR01244 family sulfur transferase [Altererythrobacter sp. Root672]|uniref:TIGR01244 family sulfur transferase n=1 Tax=Altererythrobacter sp. Root672 TaxID=1736584 RepID=UPI0006F48133|nr:TIGR01244 family sulfur transferase [Altererythrobacter sp. Root672]KRA81432.1 hypothetical protein ASD76_12850 [Altererythrobacter sp. Root672]
MSDFRKVTDSFWASPQIGLSDVAEARMLGFTLIINNRPEGEVDDQTSGREIAEATHAAGMDYCAIPVTPGGFSESQVDAMVTAIDGARGPVLAYCRSGTRSTLLWSLAQAARGMAPEDITAAAAGAGYDVGPIRPLIDTLIARRQG